MPPTPPFTVDDIDFDAPRADKAAVFEVLPHRGAFAQLDSVVWWAEDCHRAIGTRVVRNDEFWVEGHIPGRPLFPGVLMIETAAQLCSFTNLQMREGGPFLGFTRCDDCVFRSQVVPGDTVIFYAELLSSNSRRFVSKVHAFVGAKLVMEVTVTGMVM